MNLRHFHFKGCKQTDLFVYDELFFDHRRQNEIFDYPRAFLDDPQLIAALESLFDSFGPIEVIREPVSIQRKRIELRHHRTLFQNVHDALGYMPAILACDGYLLIARNTAFIVVHQSGMQHLFELLGQIIV